ncbi:MAG: hypothetical protein KDH18_02260, partial [Rhodoferax sp.]|nr:hypothetical protein [Rhodoferax sp.]
MYETRLPLGAIAFALILLGSAAVAQTGGTQLTAPTADTRSSTPARATGIAAQYGASIGTTEEAGAVIDAMRTGKDVTVGDVTVSGTGKSMGWGNVEIAMALAKSQVAADATSKEFLSALDQVMDMRSSGMGWGQVAKDLGVNLGQVMSSSRTGKSKQATVAVATSRPAGAKASGPSADKGHGRSDAGKQAGPGQAAGQGA